MATMSPVHRSTRALFALALALALAVGAGACGGDDGDASTTTTERDATTTTAETTTTSGPDTTEDPGDEEAAAIAAYEDHWAVFYAFMNGEGPGEPADHFTGARLADLPTQVADFTERGLEAKGAPDSEITEVLVEDARASLTDCQIDGTFATSRATGEVEVPAGTIPREVTAQLTKEDGTWKVASVVYSAEGSCTR